MLKIDQSDKKETELKGVKCVDADKVLKHLNLFFKSDITPAQIVGTMTYSHVITVQIDITKTKIHIDSSLKESLLNEKIIHMYEHEHEGCRYVVVTLINDDTWYLIEKGLTTRTQIEPLIERIRNISNILKKTEPEVDKVFEVISKLEKYDVSTIEELKKLIREIYLLNEVDKKKSTEDQQNLKRLQNFQKQITAEIHALESQNTKTVTDEKEKSSNPIDCTYLVNNKSENEKKHNNEFGCNVTTQIDKYNKSGYDEIDNFFTEDPSSESAYGELDALTLSEIKNSTASDSSQRDGFETEQKLTSNENAPIPNSGVTTEKKKQKTKGVKKNTNTEKVEPLMLGKHKKKENKHHNKRNKSDSVADEETQNESVLKKEIKKKKRTKKKKEQKVNESAKKLTLVEDKTNATNQKKRARENEKNRKPVKKLKQIERTSSEMISKPAQEKHEFLETKNLKELPITNKTIMCYIYFHLFTYFDVKDDDPKTINNIKPILVEIKNMLEFIKDCSKDTDFTKTFPTSIEDYLKNKTKSIALEIAKKSIEKQKKPNGKSYTDEEVRIATKICNGSKINCDILYKKNIQHIAEELYKIFMSDFKAIFFEDELPDYRRVNNSVIFPEKKYEFILAKK